MGRRDCTVNNPAASRKGFHAEETKMKHTATEYEQKALDALAEADRVQIEQYSPSSVDWLMRRAGIFVGLAQAAAITEQTTALSGELADRLHDLGQTLGH